MSEDERQEMLRTATEAHAALREAAFKLRRELTLKAPPPLATSQIADCVTDAVTDDR